MSPVMGVACERRPCDGLWDVLWSRERWTTQDDEGHGMVDEAR